MCHGHKWMGMGVFVCVCVSSGGLFAANLSDNHDVRSSVDD